MVDKFQNIPVASNSPATNGFPIVPNDLVDFPQACRGIYIGGGGIISLITVKGDELIFKNTVAGTILPVRAARVKATGTTATDMIGLY